MTQGTTGKGAGHPAFWKRWVVSMLAVYPPLVLLVYGSRELLQGVPPLASLFLIALVLTGLSTGLIVPFLQRRLAGWLQR